MNYGIAPTLLRTPPNSIRPYPDTLSLCGLSRRAHDMIEPLKIPLNPRKVGLGGKIDITAERKEKSKQDASRLG